VTTVFGEAAEAYDDVRPGYSPDLGAAIVDYHGPVRSVVEIGAGTGKGTEVLVGLGAPVLCVEPDPRMAAVLRSRFPGVTVHIGTFEEWVPPAGGVPLVACALAWHWLDERSRNERVHTALVPGGTLAVFGHFYGCADPEQEAALDAAYATLDAVGPRRPDGWFHGDIADSGLFTDVEVRTFRREVELTRQRYLELVQTFSPFLRKPPQRRAYELAVLGAAIGDTMVLDLRTTLVLARRPA
jgi:SAM-dependent methyltransferase